jgi:hypothetical protein
MRRRVLVVSYHAANPLTPRGGRTQAVVAALSAHADVRVIGGRLAARRRTWWHRARDRALFEAGSRWLLDSFEPWSWKTLPRRSPDADIALLIGFPVSPLVFAATALRRHGVPYLVDMSDPWMLTSSVGRAPTLRERRGAALERELWRGASGGIVTTAAQARDLLGIVPTLDVLVRANGYTHVDAIPAPTRREADGELRIGHFGNLYAPRVDVTGFLRRVAESGRWRRVVFHQYGRDHYGELRKLSQLVAVRPCDPIPWPEVVRRAAPELDVALVVGNTDPRQLPSKAIEYLTLPIPRLALSGSLAGDALAGYVEGKPGWLALSVNEPDPATRIWEHVHHDWSPEDLAPPPDESWSHVAEQLANFVLRRIPSEAS